MTTDAFVTTKIIAAPCARVFKAWTDPHVMAKWFFAGMGWTAHVRNELRIGGGYQLDMSDQGQVVFRAYGEYREISPVTRLSFTWNSDVVKDTLVIVNLRAQGESTELTLRHELLPDAERVQRHGGGWEACIASLDRHLAANNSKGDSHHV